MLNGQLTMDNGQFRSGLLRMTEGGESLFYLCRPERSIEDAQSKDPYPLEFHTAKRIPS